MEKKCKRHVLVDKQGRELLSADSTLGLIGKILLSFLLIVIILGFITLIESIF